MNKERALFVVAVVMAAAACSNGSASRSSGGGSAEASIADRTYKVSEVELSFEAGESGYFRIDGNDAANRDQDCVPGLSGGIALYGDVPSSVASLADLNGKELPFEFSGDGDDANLCFVGTNGLLGVETGTVRFTAVQGEQVTFTFSGSFKVYDGEGGESPTPVNASGSGTAYLSK
jgi:hypothetical protein